MERAHNMASSDQNHSTTHPLFHAATPAQHSFHTPQSCSININQRLFNQPPSSLLSNLFQNMLIQGRVMRHKPTMGHYCDRAVGGEEKPPGF